MTGSSAAKPEQYGIGPRSEIPGAEKLYCLSAFRTREKFSGRRRPIPAPPGGLFVFGLIIQRRDGIIGGGGERLF